MPTTEEITIIEGLRNGGNQRERAAYKLWDQFFYFMYWDTARQLLPKDEIQQAYADTIRCVIDNIDNGQYKEQPTAQLKTYVGTIFHHKCLDHLKQNNQKSSAQKLKNPLPITDSLLCKLPDDAKNAVDKMITDETKQELKKRLEKMGKPCKELLELSIISQYKDKELAEMMGYNSADVVKQTRSRCMNKLRQYINNLYKHE